MGGCPEGSVQHFIDVLFLGREKWQIDIDTFYGVLIFEVTEVQRLLWGLLYFIC